MTSDTNKDLLLKDPAFIPYLVDALRVNEPHHPRYNLNDNVKAWCEMTHAECIHQLGLFEPGRKALMADPSVPSVLQAVAEKGMSAEAKDFALKALAVLSDRQLQANADGQKHVMLSYQWDYQSTMKRVNASLIARGYATWFGMLDLSERIIIAITAVVLTVISDAIVW